MDAKVSIKTKTKTMTVRNLLRYRSFKITRALHVITFLTLSKKKLPAFVLENLRSFLLCINVKWNFRAYLQIYLSTFKLQCKMIQNSNATLKKALLVLLSTTIYIIVYRFYVLRVYILQITFRNSI